jgi:hypothetical protein
MDKNQNIELSNLNQNKPDFLRSDSNSSDVVVLRNRNNESIENLNGKSDNGVTLRRKPNSNVGMDNPSFVNDENDLILENKDNIQIEPEEFDSIINGFVYVCLFFKLFKTYQKFYLFVTFSLSILFFS